jgi:hypothetical protein
MIEQARTDLNIALAKTRDLTMKNIRYQTTERGKFWILYSPPAFNQASGQYERRPDAEIAQVWDDLVHGTSNGMLEGQRVIAAELMEGGSWVSDLKHVRNPAIVTETPIVTTETSLDDVMDVPDELDDIESSLDDLAERVKGELGADSILGSVIDSVVARDKAALREPHLLEQLAAKPKKSRKKKGDAA